MENIYNVDAVSEVHQSARKEVASDLEGGQAGSGCKGQSGWVGSERVRVGQGWAGRAVTMVGGDMPVGRCVSLQAH